MTARRGLFSVVALALAAALAWGAVGSFSTEAWGQEDTIVIERAHAGAHRPSLDEPIFVLVLGSDARDGLPDNTRYDSIHIVGIAPGSKRGAIVGIPRDSYVQSAAGNGTRKMTDLGFLDGKDGFIRTVESFSGCSFDYTMRVAFDGFAGDFWKADSNERAGNGGGLINALGGVTVKIPQPGLNDRDALHRLPPIPPGTQHLNGPQALAWSRSRKQLPYRARGDFARSEAQGSLMLDLLAEMRRDYREDPGTTLRNIAAVKRTVDVNIPLDEMLELGLFGLRLKPKRVRNIVVDGFATTRNGSSIVEVTARGRAQLTDVCADGLLDSV